MGPDQEPAAWTTGDAWPPPANDARETRHLSQTRRSPMEAPNLGTASSGCSATPARPRPARFQPDGSASVRISSETTNAAPPAASCRSGRRRTQSQFHSLPVPPVLQSRQSSRSRQSCSPASLPVPPASQSRQSSSPASPPGPASPAVPPASRSRQPPSPASVPVPPASQSRQPPGSLRRPPRHARSWPWPCHRSPQPSANATSATGLRVTGP